MAVKKKVPRKKATAKKKVVKKPARKSTKAKKTIKTIKKPKENVIGTITHYFPKVQAAVIKLKAAVAIGDTLKFKGHTTDFTQSVTSMQIDHVTVTAAKKGEEIGLLVNSRVREHDAVIKE
jgi:putative protease